MIIIFTLCISRLDDLNQKIRQNWTQLDDNSMKFFQAEVAIRRRSNKILEN